jgi:signal transduction histidine kinase
MPIGSFDHQEQLVRGLTHRMNNILSLFHGYLGLLSEERKLDPLLREGLARMREGAREATELIERTSAITRSTPGCVRKLDPGEFLRQLAPTFESMRTSQVQIVAECADDLPPVKADASRLKLALTELIQNACEAAASRVLIRVTACGKPRCEAIALAAETPGNESQIVIEVIDDGRGIPAASDRQIFEPFFSTKKGQPSAGLGLAVALGCARQLGGSIDHARKDGRTIFRLALPASLRHALTVAA